MAISGRELPECKRAQLVLTHSSLWSAVPWVARSITPARLSKPKHETSQRGRRRRRSVSTFSGRSRRDQLLQRRPFGTDTLSAVEWCMKALKTIQGVCG